MVLRIWLLVLVLSSGYYASRIYGDTLDVPGEQGASLSHRLNYDD